VNERSFDKLLNSYHDNYVVVSKVAVVSDKTYSFSTKKKPLFNLIGNALIKANITGIINLMYKV